MARNKLLIDPTELSQLIYESGGKTDLAVNNGNSVIFTSETLAVFIEKLQEKLPYQDEAPVPVSQSAMTALQPTVTEMHNAVKLSMETSFKAVQSLHESHMILTNMHALLTEVALADSLNEGVKTHPQRLIYTLSNKAKNMLANIRPPQGV